MSKKLRRKYVVMRVYDSFPNPQYLAAIALIVCPTYVSPCAIELTPSPDPLHCGIEDSQMLDSILVQAAVMIPPSQASQ